jgi:phosphatidylinositol glycan class U
MRYNFLVCNVFIYCTFLSPIFWYIWIYQGSGNANFFYAITLVFGLGQIILLSDLFFAMIKSEFISKYPEARDKKITQVAE